MRFYRLFKNISVLLIASAFFVYGKPDIPWITARTTSVNSESTRQAGPAGSTIDDTFKGLGVEVSLRFLSPPKPYIVQCFFVARDQNSKEKYIYDIQKATSSAVVDKFNFKSAILSERNHWISITSNGTFTGTVANSNIAFAGNYEDTSVTSQQTLGSKFDGWIVRVISGETVVRIESNQQPLKEMANKFPDVLNAAVRDQPSTEVSTSIEFGGIGAVIGSSPSGHPAISNLVRDGAAYAAGIRLDDVLLKVDDIDVTNLPIEEIVAKIRGPVGTKVTLTIIRPNEDIPITGTIVRKKVSLSSK